MSAKTSGELDCAAPTIGDAVISILEEVGIDVCFGVPGGQTIPVYEAARRRGFNHVLMRDERNAAAAADAYARVSGKVGVCDATVGPGASNLVSGLAEAYASSIPVLAIVADTHRDREHLRSRGVASQAADQHNMLSSVSKWVGRVTTEASVYDVFNQALRVATSGRPGPVSIEIPEDVFRGETDNQFRRTFGKADACWPRHRPGLDDVVLERAVEILATAERPVVIAGGGALASGAEDHLTRFMEELGIPVATTPNGKGCVDERHPLALGVVGVFGHVHASQQVLNADVVLILGSKRAQFNTFMWRVPSLSQRVIQIDVDGEELGRTGSNELDIVADAREAARLLVDALLSRKKTFGGLADLDRIDQPGTHPGDPALPPESVVQAASALMAPSDIMVADASLASGWAAVNFVVREPGRCFIAPRGLAGIGWSGGAAIGAALARPGVRVVAVAGDGAAAYWLGEIETAVRLSLPITYIVLNNSAFGWIVQGERSLGISPMSTFGPIDFAGVAKSMGAAGYSLDSKESLRETMSRALSESGPSVIDVKCTALGSPSVDYALLDPSAVSPLGAYGMA